MILRFQRPKRALTADKIEGLELVEAVVDIERMSAKQDVENCPDSEAERDAASGPWEGAHCKGRAPSAPGPRPYVR